MSWKMDFLPAEEGGIATLYPWIAGNEVGFSMNLSPEWGPPLQLVGGGHNRLWGTPGILPSGHSQPESLEALSLES